MEGTDYISEILKFCQKREAILMNRKRSMSRYNQYGYKILELATKLFNENRQDELLPYLESNSISTKYDIACLLFHFYPERCNQTLREIADMTMAEGLPRRLIIVTAMANNILKNGTPVCFP